MDVMKMRSNLGRGSPSSLTSLPVAQEEFNTQVCGSKSVFHLHLFRFLTMGHVIVHYLSEDGHRDSRSHSINS